MKQHLQSRQEMTLFSYRKFALKAFPGIGDGSEGASKLMKKRQGSCDNFDNNKGESVGSELAAGGAAAVEPIVSSDITDSDGKEDSDYFV